MLRRYLLREIVAPFFAWAGLLFVLFFVMAFLRGTDFLLGSAVTAGDFARFTLSLSPQFVVQAMPIALLLAILLGLGRLSEDRELVAMQALGIRPSAFFLAPLMLGVLLSLVMLGLAFTLQPWGMSSLRSVAQDIIRRNLVSDIRSGTFHEEVPGLTLYAEKVEPGNRWTNVLLFDGRDPAAPVLAVSQHGHVGSNEAVSSVVFELTNGSAHRASRATTEYTTLEFEQGSFRADVGEAFFQNNKFRTTSEERTPAQLQSDLDQARERGEPTSRLQTQLHWRFGQIVMPFAFACLGTPLALSRRRGGRGRGFLLTLASYVGFYVLARAAVQFGEAGQIPGWLAGQLANVVFIAAGLALMVLVDRRGAV